MDETVTTSGPTELTSPSIISEQLPVTLTIRIEVGAVSAFWMGCDTPALFDFEYVGDNAISRDDMYLT